MHDCEYYNTMLSVALDDELSLEEKVELSGHLQTCDRCREYQSMLQAVSGALRGAQVHPPDKLRKGIQYKVELEASRKRFAFGAYGRWTVIAAVICLAVLGIVKLAPLGASKNATSTAYRLADQNVTADSASAPQGVRQDDMLTKSFTAGAGTTEAAPEEMVAPADNGMMLRAPAPESAPDTDVEGGVMQMEPPAAIRAAEDGAAEKSAVYYSAEDLPGFAVFQSLGKTAPYYSVCIFYGQRPSSVSPETGCTLLDAPQGQERWLVPLNTMLALELAEDFDELYYGDLMEDQGLVVVLTEMED